MTEKQAYSTLNRTIRACAGSRIFGAEFVKADGSRRKMACRLGVTKGLRSPPGSWNGPREGEILTVWDMHKGAYRSIRLDRLRTLSIGGKLFRVKGVTGS